MSTLPQLEEKIYSLVPELKELTFGCRVDIKRYDHFGHLDEGTYGRVVKDLRESDYLPMLVDAGDQLEFYVQPDEDVEIEIIGHEIHPHHWLPLLGDEYAMNSNGDLLGLGNSMWFYLLYDGTDRQVWYDFQKSFSEQSPEFLTWLWEALNS